RRVFSVALANGLVERNPVKAVKFFHEPSGRVRFLTQSARKLICATARTRRRGPPTTPRSLTSSEPQAAKSLGRRPHAPTPSRSACAPPLPPPSYLDERGSFRARGVTSRSRGCDADPRDRR